MSAMDLHPFDTGSGFPGPRQPHRPRGPPRLKTADAILTKTQLKGNHSKLPSVALVGAAAIV